MLVLPFNGTLFKASIPQSFTAYTSLSHSIFLNQAILEAVVHDLLSQRSHYSFSVFWCLLIKVLQLLLPNLTNVH